MARQDALPRSRMVSLEGKRARRDWARMAVEYARSAAFLEPTAVWILTRALFVLLTYFGVILFQSALHDPAHPSLVHQLLPAWQRWDGQWYIDIAQRGYGWKKAVGTSPTAFFPLYSALIRIVVMATHRSYIVSALLVSNAAFLGALLYLWRLARWEINGRVASRAVLYIAVFPTALFFFAGYTESLFLFVTVACFFHLRRREWLLAGLFAALASATRVTGVLLLLPFFYEYARSRNFDVRRVDSGVAGLLVAPLGLVAFMAYLHATVGDAMAFTQSQHAWQKIFTPWLWSGLLESVRQIVVVQPSASFFEAHNVINLAVALAFLAGSVLAARRLPASYAIYLAGFWLVTLSSPAMANGYPVPLISMSRYVLSLFPVFMYLGMLGVRDRFHSAYLVGATGMLALFTVQFLKGGWII
jgi:Gpi18-like mannosyltransferase